MSTPTEQVTEYSLTALAQLPPSIGLLILVISVFTVATNFFWYWMFRQKDNDMRDCEKHTRELTKMLSDERLENLKEGLKVAEALRELSQAHIRSEREMQRLGRGIDQLLFANGGGGNVTN